MTTQYFSEVPPKMKNYKKLLKMQNKKLFLKLMLRRKLMPRKQRMIKVRMMIKNPNQPQLKRK